MVGIGIFELLIIAAVVLVPLAVVAVVIATMSNRRK